MIDPQGGSQDPDLGPTLGKTVSQVAARLFDAGLCFGHGTDNEWDEAMALVVGAAGIDDSGALADDRPLSKAQLTRVAKLLASRVNNRVPLPYLLGRVRFAGIELGCDPRALVPRSPIGELIEEGFSPWVEADGVTRVLDLCTGGGAIALGCAAAFPGARVDATDLSPEALALAGENAVRLELDSRVSFLCGDLFGPVHGQRYDLIVSNPPYVPPEEFDALPPEFAHEPDLGLVADDDGLAIVKRILAQAVRHLMPGGVLIVEVGYSADALRQSMPDVPFLWLEFARGGEGVFLLERDQLVALEEAAR